MSKEVAFLGSLTVDSLHKGSHVRSVSLSYEKGNDGYFLCEQDKPKEKINYEADQLMEGYRPVRSESVKKRVKSRCDSSKGEDESSLPSFSKVDVKDDVLKKIAQNQVSKVENSFLVHFEIDPADPEELETNVPFLQMQAMPLKIDVEQLCHELGLSRNLCTMTHILKEKDQLVVFLLENQDLEEAVDTYLIHRNGSESRGIFPRMARDMFAKLDEEYQTRISGLRAQKEKLNQEKKIAEENKKEEILTKIISLLDLATKAIEEAEQCYQKSTEFASSSYFGMESIASHEELYSKESTHLLRTTFTKTTWACIFELKETDVAFRCGWKCEHDPEQLKWFDHDTLVCWQSQRLQFMSVQDGSSLACFYTPFRPKFTPFEFAPDRLELLSEGILFYSALFHEDKDKSRSKFRMVKAWLAPWKTLESEIPFPSSGTDTSTTTTSTTTTTTTTTQVATATTQQSLSQSEQERKTTFWTRLPPSMLLDKDQAQKMSKYYGEAGQMPEDCTGCMNLDVLQPVTLLIPFQEAPTTRKRKMEKDEKEKQDEENSCTDLPRLLVRQWIDKSLICIPHLDPDYTYPKRLLDHYYITRLSPLKKQNQVEWAANPLFQTMKHSLTPIVSELFLKDYVLRVQKDVISIWENHGEALHSPESDQSREKLS